MIKDCWEILKINLNLKDIFQEPEWSRRLRLWNIPTASLQRDKTPPTNMFLLYNIKQYDGEAPVMLELWGILSTPSLPSLPGLLWPGEVAPDRILSMGQIELFDI